uniref:Uncharacterized protein n=1 Tax=Arundo donax TaxID=35708 RepID=A0A0A9AZQ4_ARUDO
MNKLRRKQPWTPHSNLTTLRNKDVILSCYCHKKYLIK